MDALRVVLVDPLDETREALQRLLQGLDGVWLTEVCKAYAAASRAIAEQKPNIVVIGIDAHKESALALIASLTKEHPNTAVLPAGQEPQGDLILRTVRAGAREFLTLPADASELLTAIGNLVQTPARGAAVRLGGRVIVFAGAAGGVGCTSLAVNVAASLARDTARSVALVDFDLFTGAVDACLDIAPNYTLLDVATNADRLDLTLLKRSMGRHASGVFVLPRPAALEDAGRIDPDAIGRVIALLKAAFSVVVIDVSKALHSTDFVAFEMCDALALVAQLDLACLRNTARLAELLRQADGMTDKLKFVINRVGQRDCQIQPKKAEELLRLRASWTIPEAPTEFTLSRSKGVPIVTDFARSRAQKAIEQMASGLDAPAEEAREATPQPVRRIAAMF
jgi:pilus assembly protein CpaE